MATAVRADVLQVAARYQASTSAIGHRLALTLAALWARTDPRDPAGSWTPLVGQAVAAFTAAQAAAAGLADGYATDVLTAQDGPQAPSGLVNARAFAGYTAAGGTLDGLLLIPAERAGYALRQGAPAPLVTDLARRLLGMYARTEVADAARGSSAAAGVARGATGYVRALRAPSCARCAILAGRWYRYSAGFQRHPHCDCVHVPAGNTIGADLTTSPAELFRSGQVHGLSRAESEAIRLGADPGQVVNARDGMYRAGDGRKYTTAGTTRRGLAGSRMRAAGLRARPSVETVLTDSTSPEDAASALRAYGYLI